MCKQCKKKFSIDHRKKPEILWISYIDGKSMRSLADERGISHPQIYARLVDELQLLPKSNEITKTHCTEWSGVLNVDGKYVTVKGYKQKIPVIYGIDFLKHDISIELLAESESVRAYERFFLLLKKCNYPLKVVICDDVSTLKIALKRVFPKAKIQLCHTHYIENIRQRLHIARRT